MLQTCGINSIVSVNMNERNVLLPQHDKDNSYKYYKCNKLWRLLVASNQLQKLNNNSKNNFVKLFYTISFFIMNFIMKVL